MCASIKRYSELCKTNETRGMSEYHDLRLSSVLFTFWQIIIGIIMKIHTSY